jgi:DNA-binding SARP family transcriptional activator
MDFRLLGPLEVWHEGRALELRGLKRRAVLALLLLRANEVVSRDRLIDELWEEHPPANASAALQNHVSRLRKELGPDVLVTKESGYLLVVDPDALDVRRFETLVAEAEALEAPERRAKLDEALSLWRGRALGDLLDEHALAVESSRLEGLRLSALEHRIDADLELGLHEQAVPELEALIVEHPLREHLRALLILALYRCGRQAEALDAYRETRRMLVEELGIEPGSELRELEKAILCQDPALAVPQAPRPQPARPSAPMPGTSRRRRRSQLLLVAAAMLLAGAGVAAAIVVSGKTPAGQLQAAGATTVDFSAHLTSSRTGTRTQDQQQLTVTRTTTTATTTKPRKGGDGKVEHHGTTGAIGVVNGLTVSPPPAPPPPPPPPQPSGGPPPPPPPTWEYSLTDDFTNPDVDAMWGTTKSGPGIDMAETGELEVWVPADPAPDLSKGVGEIYWAGCKVIGDFDATVDYKLISWPAGDGLRLALWAGVSAVGRDFTVARVGGHADGFGGEAYQSNVHADTRMHTADTHGGLRLHRRKGVLSAYYRYRGGWIRLGTQKAKGQATLGLSFRSDDPPWGGKPARAAFDNFKAVVAGVDCPAGTPVPPRERRR